MSDISRHRSSHLQFFYPLLFYEAGRNCSTAGKSQPLVLIYACLTTEGLKLFLESPTPSPSIVQTQVGTHLSEEGWSDLNTCSESVASGLIFIQAGLLRSNEGSDTVDTTLQPPECV